MAQIIKHRRGSILSLKDVSANIGELVVGTGSINDLNGPVLFVGHTAVNGGYNPVSKIYQGTAAPSISVGSHGSTMDGVPFYSTAAQTLYILDKSGNIGMDLTGNIEGNLISGVTINVVSGNTANYQNISGSFTGSGIGLYDIPASGITGLNLSQIADGAVTASVNSTNGFRVNTNSIISGSLTVTGSTYTTSDVFITGNTYQTGSINLTGDVVLKGNISIGDSLTGDTVTLNSEISSSLTPAENNQFDLGSLDNAWRNLYVSGTAYIENISLAGISVNTISLPNDLTVSGTTSLSGSVLVQDLTNNRVVIAGVDGLLEDDANFTFNGTELNIGVGNFTVQQSSGNVDTVGTLNVGGATTLESSLDVTGSANFKNNVIVSGTTTISGSTYVQYLTQNRILLAGSGGKIEDNNNLIYDTSKLQIGMGQFEVDVVDGDIRTSGSISVDTNLSVVGTTSISGATTIDNTLLVTNNSSLKGTLNVTGATQMMSTLNVDGESTLASVTVEDLTDNRIVIVGVGGALEDDSNFTFNGTELNIGQGKFTVQQSSGNILTQGNTSVEGNLSVTGTTSISGATVIDDTLRVTGNSSLQGTLSVTGATSLLSGLTVNGNETVNGVLTVTGNTQLGGNLYVSGNLEVLGSATNVNIQSTTVEIGDNIILVNAYSPFQRYAGITAYDSGSVGTSGSLLYDSLNDYWIFQNSDATTSKLVGVSGTTMGSEASLTSGTIPVAMAGNKIKDSLLGDSGTQLSYNTNKFTVESSDGATTIGGNVTLSSGGGSDATNKTSAIVFKNSSNVLGYVSTTETTDVLDGILGYKNSNGALVFSTVIDGGGY